VSVANLDIAGAKNLSVILSCFYVLGTYNFVLFFRQREAHLCRGKPDRSNPILRSGFPGYQFFDLFDCTDYIAPVAVLAAGNVSRVRRTQFEPV
jgi:hypothetical protein